MNKLLLTASILACSHLANAGGFKIGAQGQKALGMAHIGIGFAQDASSVYFNPGAMSFTQNQLSLGVHFLAPRSSYLDSATNTLTNANNAVFTPFQLYATKSLGKRKKLTAGFGAYTPYGSGISYPGTWTGRYVLTNISLQAVYLQPTLAYKINNNFSLGAGFIYAIGNVTLEKDVPVATSAGDVGHALLKGHGNGMGFNTGAYYQDSNLSLGAVYHSRVDMKVKGGNATFTNIPTLAAASFPNTTFDSKLPLASEMGFGGAYRFGKGRRTAIAADFNYTFWNSYDSLGFDYATNTSALSDAKSPRLYEDAYAIRIGAQHQFNNNFALRGGYFYDQTPVQNGYLAPELPDNNKHGLTLGASYAVDKQLTIDASLLYENVPERGEKNIESNMAGTFATTVIAPGIGITYRFTKNKWN
jgi:long-chain fatty acid transport protein